MKKNNNNGEKNDLTIEQLSKHILTFKLGDEDHKNDLSLSEKIEKTFKVLSPTNNSGLK